MAGYVPHDAPCCNKFEPNPFKIAILLQKENCKHCGRPWTEHRGVISENLIEGYLQAIRKAADDWQKMEAQVKAKVEDDWLFDGAQDLESAEDEADSDVDSDDDIGFRMLSPTSLAGTTSLTMSSQSATRRPKVLNLIDFGECNVHSEHPPLCSTRSSTSSFDTCLELDVEPSFTSSGSDPGTCSTSRTAECGTSQYDVINSCELDAHLDSNVAGVAVDEDHCTRTASADIDALQIQRQFEELQVRNTRAEAALHEAHLELQRLREEVDRGGAVRDVELLKSESNPETAALVLELRDVCMGVRECYAKHFLESPQSEQAPGTGGSDAGSNGSDLEISLQCLRDAAAAAHAAVSAAKYGFSEVVLAPEDGTCAAAAPTEVSQPQEARWHHPGTCQSPRDASSALADKIAWVPCQGEFVAPLEQDEDGWALESVRQHSRDRLSGKWKKLGLFWEHLKDLEDK